MDIKYLAIFVVFNLYNIFTTLLEKVVVQDEGDFQIISPILHDLEEI